MAESDPLIGKTLSHYRILERVGAGGVGVVYRALDEHFECGVAFKFNEPRKCRSDAIISEKSDRTLRQVIHFAGVRRFGETQPYGFVSSCMDRSNCGFVFMLMWPLG